MLKKGGNHFVYLCKAQIFAHFKKINRDIWV